MTATILVTGGAGYVGAHVCLRLHEAGYRPVVYDNLSNGSAAFVKWGSLEQGDILDGRRLDEVFSRHRPEAIVHLAGLIEVGESTRNPGAFYRTNVAGSLNLIEAAMRAGAEKLVFSSSCAIYGEPVRLPIGEDHPQNPLNPYGRSKLMVEQALADFDSHLGFRAIALRYFNAAGAADQHGIGEAHDPETHAIPLLLETALGRRPQFTVFGDDYPTPDGAAVRDYVHVLDLADAHVLALRRLIEGGPSEQFNLGAGVGTSVTELIAIAEAVSGRSIPVSHAPRRAGDAAALVADTTRAHAELGWAPRFGIAETVASAWRWHSAASTE